MSIGKIRHKRKGNLNFLLLSALVILSMHLPPACWAGTIKGKVLTDISYYLEVKYKFLPGLFGALRYNGIYFNKISYSNGEKDKWDYDVQRWQLGVGYAFSRRLEVCAEYMINRTIGPYDPVDNLFALQWTWRF